MSDALHVTIDDLLFIIGPNTANISSLDVSLSPFRKQSRFFIVLMIINDIGLFP